MESNNEIETNKKLKIIPEDLDDIETNKKLKIIPEGLDDIEIYTQQDNDDDDDGQIVEVKKNVMNENDDDEIKNESCENKSNETHVYSEIELGLLNRRYGIPKNKSQFATHYNFEDEEVRVNSENPPSAYFYIPDIHQRFRELIYSFKN